MLRRYSLGLWPTVRAAFTAFLLSAFVLSLFRRIPAAAALELSATTDGNCRDNPNGRPFR
jgi:hypothetical protein